jgi:signal peptidase I
MAEEKVQTSPAKGPSAAQTDGQAGNGAPAVTEPAEASLLDEVRQFAGWWAGLVIVLVCGWGAIAAAALATRSTRLHLDVVLAIASALSLGIFLLLERHFWLSRLMSLRVPTALPWWASAMLLWGLGVPGLLFRSTAPKPHAATDAEGKPKPAEAAQPTDSGREIVETVVFVVVLVLLLKSFVAEAFVIPTGSMAETLYGYQKIVTCPSCHYKFPVNCSNEVDPQDGRGRQDVDVCICPNCLQKIHLGAGRTPTDPGVAAVTDPGPSTGDRVLVAKFLSEVARRPPGRLDVVVFKFPGNSHADSSTRSADLFPATGPYKNHTPMNYIKRLIGLSGETIAIYAGDVYVLRPPADGKPRFDDLDKYPREEREWRARQLWQFQYTHRTTFREGGLDILDGGDDEKAPLLWRQGAFEIIRKGPEHILAMKRIVYDNDFPPTDKVGQMVADRWRGEGWTPHKPTHSFQIDGAGGAAPVWLRYNHILRGSDGTSPELITDFMGYNSGPHLNQAGVFPPSRGANWVGDLILEAEVEVRDPSGKLTLELSKGADRFQARWDLKDGTCKLVRLADGEAEKEIGSAATTLSKKGTYQVRFANVDHRLTVWVDRSLPFGDGVPYDAPSRVGPTKNDLEPASIGSTGASVTVGKLKLWRDTYYTITAGEGVLGEEVLRDPSLWGKKVEPRVMTMYVQPGHYLCLGDNSPQSSDGRSWGLVPERLMLGRALLVYYPFDRWGNIK